MHVDALTDRVCDLAATVFAVPRDQVKPDSSTETVEQWDSLGRLALVLELEQAFGLSIQPEQSERMTSVREVVAVLAELGVADGAAVAL